MIKINWKWYREHVPFRLRVALYWIYSWIALAIDIVIFIPILFVLDTMVAMKRALCDNVLLGWSCHQKRMDYLKLAIKHRDDTK